MPKSRQVSPKYSEERLTAALVCYCLMTAMVPLLSVYVGFELSEKITALVILVFCALLALEIYTLITGNRNIVPYAVAKTAALLLLPALYTCLLIFVLLWLPSMSWDGLSHWLVHSHKMIVAQSTDIDGYFHHPRLYSAAIALFGSATSLYSATETYPAFLSVISVLSVACAVHLFCRGFEIPLNFTIYATLVLAMLPIFENHVYLFGYTEIPIFTLFFCGMTFTLLYTKSHRIWHMILAFSFYVSLGLMKLYSPIYSIIGVASLLSVAVPRLFVASIMVFMSVVTATILFQSELLISICDRKFGLSVEKELFYVAWYTFPMVAPSFLEVFSIYKTSFISNMSFSILASLVFFCVGLQFKNIRPVSSARQRAVGIPLVSLLVFEFLFLFTPYGFKTAVPGADTGFSRQNILVVAPCFFIILVTVFRLIDSRNSNVVGARNDTTQTVRSNG